MKTSARLENFPIMMFAIVMGMSGLSIAYQKASHLFHFTKVVPNTLAALTSVIFITAAIGDVPSDQPSGLCYVMVDGDAAAGIFDTLYYQLLD